MRRIFINKLILAIKANWPLEQTGIAYIEQDNSPPHMRVNDKDFIQAANGDGFIIHFKYQLLKNPYLNILDIGFFFFFFIKIQSIQHQQRLRNILELVSAVSYAYEIFDPKNTIK